MRIVIYRFQKADVQCKQLSCREYVICDINRMLNILVDGNIMLCIEQHYSDGLESFCRSAWLTSWNLIEVMFVLKLEIG